MKRRGPLSEKSNQWMLFSVIVGALIIMASMVVAYYFFNTYNPKQEIKQLADTAQTLQQNLLSVSQNGTEKIQSEEDKKQEAIKARLRAGDTAGIKVVFFTFDDGPSENTNTVLDILKTSGIKGTFFTRGREGATAEAAYKRIVAEGHTLGNHTYNHSYDLYKHPEEFYADVKLLEDYQKKLTATEPSMLFRFPGGSLNANKTCIKGILDRGYNYADWNVSTGDAAPTPPSVDQIVSAVVGGVHNHDVSVVLCHAEVKENTRQALPVIINQLKSEGYTFLPMEKDFTYPRQLEL